MATTRKAAITQGKRLGLTGAHKMPDGTWHPGKTHKDFMNAQKRTRGK